MGSSLLAEAVYKGVTVRKYKRPQSAEGEGVKNRNFCPFGGRRNHLGLLRCEFNLPMTLIRSPFSKCIIYYLSTPTVQQLREEQGLAEAVRGNTRRAEIRHFAMEDKFSFWWGK